MYLSFSVSNMELQKQYKRSSGEKMVSQKLNNCWRTYNMMEKKDLLFVSVDIHSVRKLTLPPPPLHPHTHTHFHTPSLPKTNDQNLQKLVKFLRALILQNICEQLLLKTEASRVRKRSKACQKSGGFLFKRTAFLVTLNICSKKNMRSY